MAPHRVSDDFASTNSSISDDDFPKGDKTDMRSSGSDYASNPTLSEVDPIAIVGMGMLTLLAPDSHGHVLTCEERMSSAWRCAISFKSLESPHGTAVGAGRGACRALEHR